MNTETRRKIEHLTTLSLEGAANEAEKADLASLLKSDPQCLSYYVNYVAIASALVQPEPYLQSMHAGKQDSFVDSGIWQQLAEAERTAETVQPQPEEDTKDAEVHSPQTVAVRKPQTRVSRILIAITTFSTAALLMIMALPLIAPQGKPVAVLTETMEAAWSSDKHLVAGQVLRKGEFSLQSGYAKIVMDNGAEIILRGPVDFNLEDDDTVSLTKGKLFSRVPKRAQGFTVITPEAVVVDYGTEFGVSFEPSKGTAAHVFKGQVALSTKTSKDSKERRLFANQAALIEPSGNIRALECKPDIFEMNVPTQYELAVLRQQPQGYWQMLNDETENANNPALVPSPARYVGEVGFTSGPELGNGVKRSALQLSGQGHLYIPNLQNLKQTAKTWSATLWVRPEISAAANETDQEAPNRYFILSGEGRYGYLIADSKGNLSHFYYSTQYDEWARQDVKTVLKTGQWHHIGVTVDQHANKCIYVDGVLMADKIESEDRARLYSNADGKDSVCKELYIGSVFDKGDAFVRSQRDKSFVGSIAEVAVYDHALNAETIESMYSASRHVK